MLEKFSSNALLYFPSVWFILCSDWSISHIIRRNPMNIKLGEKIRTLRKQRNISQEVLSQYLGVLIYFCDFSRFLFRLAVFRFRHGQKRPRRGQKKDGLPRPSPLRRIISHAHRADCTESKCRFRQRRGAPAPSGRNARPSNSRSGTTPSRLSPPRCRRSR